MFVYTSLLKQTTVIKKYKQNFHNMNMVRKEAVGIHSIPYRKENINQTTL
jgi:hypothetical protein